MPDARIKPLLHPAGKHRVGEQFQRGALDVVHVDPAALTLEQRELRDQGACQAGHALLVVPGVALMAGRHGAQHQVLRLPHAGNPDNFFAELARRTSRRQQRGKHGRYVACGQRLFQLNALG